ncbi:MAG: DEAD/DEAH box helicase [Alphaproteobacteria bacterium]|nr:DEAD/DEAH box helicase [Alphaproteobacteria bacterium]
MKEFKSFGLSSVLTTSLSQMNYDEPTPIQAQTIPLAMEGRDILGSAQTGTGKTAAFSIPLIETVFRSPTACALVLTPTRELAKQVLGIIHDLLGRDSNIQTSLIIGGEPMHKQFSQLKKNPRVIVGTPGRINDHLERNSIKLDKTSFLVLDETDRMLDMGFGVQLDKIVKFLPKKRQTLMFSATLPEGIIKLSGKYLNNPQRVAVGQTNVIAQNIKQEAIRIEQGDKYQELLVQLHERKGSVIVFVKTKYSADRMAKKLRQDGFTSEALHGDLRQGKRDRVMKNFHQQNFRVLIATDIAARGLDVPHIEHVINYDLPQMAEDYIHRMGRTARAGATGSALSFVSPQDGRKWHAIEVLLNPDLKKGGKEKRRGENKSRKRGNRKHSQRGDARPDKREDKPKRKKSQRGDSRPDKRKKKGTRKTNKGDNGFSPKKRKKRP